jgi:predicted acylesterase/phospholipase RssA
MSLIHLNSGSVALVLPGEAMWGALQTGFVQELGARMQEAGYGRQPFRLAVGSSSGSLIAASAAGGGPFDHEAARSAWLEFGEATRFRFRRPVNPYPGALKRIFESGLVDIRRAFDSPTHLVVTASDYHDRVVGDLWRHHARLFLTGAHVFWTGKNDRDSGRLAEMGAQLLSDGNRLFGTRYYATRPRPEGREAGLIGGDWIVVDSVESLRKAVEASSRVPLLYGNPVLDGASVLIDGVFTNNAPVELALEQGARHVFVVTSSKKGYVFDRPVQTLFRRQLLRFLRSLDRSSRALGFLPRRMHVSDALEQLARLKDSVPPPSPLDLDALRREYPEQEIHVIHATEDIPVNRFFESRPEVLGRLYDTGRELAGKVVVS